MKDHDKTMSGHDGQNGLGVDNTLPVKALNGAYPLSDIEQGIKGHGAGIEINDGLTIHTEPISYTGLPVSEEYIGDADSSAALVDTVIKPANTETAKDNTTVTVDDAKAEPVITVNKIIEAEESTFNFPPRDELNNVVLDHQVYVPIGSEEWNAAAITLALPSESSERTALYIDKLPNVSLADNPSGEKWVNVLKAGMEHGLLEDFGAGAADRPEAQWRQQIKVSGKDGVADKVLSAASPRIGDSDSPLLQGQRGILRINALLGRGSIVQIPLYHSGFWITLKTPVEGSLLDTYQRITLSKIELGRVTHGLAFANHSVFLAEAVLDLAIENLYETTIKEDITREDLRKMISSLDIPTIAWGLACTIWPRGFQYSRAVLDDKGQATRVIEEKLNLAYLHCVDTNSINEWQQRHMCSRATGSMLKTSIEIYKQHFTRGKSKQYVLDDKLNVTLKVPNSYEYIESGKLWVNSTVAMLDEALAEDLSLKVRNAIIIEHGKATSMRQYAHWVESFDLPTIGKKAADADTINLVCNSLSSDDTVREKFYKVVKQHMEDSTIAIIATPIVNVSEQAEVKPRFPWLLPLDPLSTFFTLLVQRITQIRQRP